MSRGPGRIERAIRALIDAHPDEAFTVDNLCVAWRRPGRLPRCRREVIAPNAIDE
jgi:hypothetical protein